MKLKRYLRKHPDLPPAVRKVLREAVAYINSDTGDDPVPLAMAVEDMLADKKPQKTTPRIVAADTPRTYATAVTVGLEPMWRDSHD